MDSLTKQANRYERERLRKERKFQKKLQKAIMKGLDPVIESGEADQYDTSFIDETVAELYYDTSKKFFDGTYRMVVKQKDIIGDIANIFAERVNQWLLTYGAKKIESINNTVRKKVGETLGDAFLEGLSIPQIEKRLRKDMSIWSKFEATRVARTETTAAAGRGSLEGADASGVTLRKVWIAAFDSRTRVTHKTTDQKSRLNKGIPLDDEFEVGEDKMQSPGTGNDAKENINCRCSIGYVRP